MFENRENSCRRLAEELAMICREYLNKRIDRKSFWKINADLKETYRATGEADFSFAYLLLCGYLNMFSEFEPDDNSFANNVKEVLSKLENGGYIGESWLVTFANKENRNTELLFKYWNGSVNSADENFKHEIEIILNNPIIHPNSVRDLIYNNIISLLSMWECGSGTIWINHTVGSNADNSEKLKDKLNNLFNILLGKEKLMFWFNYFNGNVCVSIM